MRESDYQTYIDLDNLSRYDRQSEHTQLVRSTAIKVGSKKVTPIFSNGAKDNEKVEKRMRKVEEELNKGCERTLSRAFQIIVFIDLCIWHHYNILSLAN